MTEKISSADTPEAAAEQYRAARELSLSDPDKPAVARHLAIESH